jgi:hypothetical protein
VGGFSLLLVACGDSSEANAPPVITTQPADQATVEGRPTTFSVNASGVPMPSLQWERMDPGGSTWAAIPGESSSTYQFMPSRPDDGARFRVQATNALGAATSNPALLTVYYISTVVLSPDFLTVRPGETATFNVIASGNPATLGYQWRRLAGGVVTDIPGAIFPSYTTPPATSADDGTQFSCTISNAFVDKNSAWATLYVR